MVKSGRNRGKCSNVPIFFFTLLYRLFYSHCIVRYGFLIVYYAIMRMYYYNN